MMLSGFPSGSDGEESACNARDLGSVPGLGRSPEEGNGYPLQYSGLENSTDKGAWQATVHGVAKSRTRLSDFHFTFLDTAILCVQLRSSCFLRTPIFLDWGPILTLGLLHRTADQPLLCINNLRRQSNRDELTAASAARPSSLPANRRRTWSPRPGKALTPSPVAVPDEEVITTQGWKRNQGCLEGIKEWENRIQAASWSPGHITAFGHSFQMPCIFECAATFSIPSLEGVGVGGQFKASTSQHNSVFKRGIEKSWERESTVKSEGKKSESRLVLSNSLDTMDYTVHGILQARILKRVAFPFSRGSFPFRDQIQVSCITGGFFTSWAIVATQKEI